MNSDKLASDRLANEWCLLQNQYDSYEKHALYIKLASIVILSITLLADKESFAIVIILSILWLQDAIWKTFQARIEPRLIQLEKSIANLSITRPRGTESSDIEQEQTTSFQFNTQYQQNACKGTALITEYLLQAIRPTIAFPHIVLIGIALGQLSLAQ